MKEEKRQIAIEMRKRGMSYSQIKEKTKVSKGTLSYWLKDMPLSPERIRELRDVNPQRIENYRNTMRKKKEARLEDVFKKVSKDIKKLSKREFYIAGLFLYWGEGGKTKESEISMSNTDPAVLKFFIKWIEVLGSEKSRLKVRIQIYKDMDEAKEIKFWLKELGLKKGQFRKTYIKKTNRLSNYKHRFSHGTCNIHLCNRDICDVVMMGLKYIGEIVHNDKVQIRS